MTDPATDGELDEAANKALKKVSGNQPHFWESLGTTRDDAKQEAMLAAWEAKSSFRGECPDGAYLYKCARNALLNYVRACEADRKRRSPLRTVQVGLDDEEVEQSYAEEAIDDEVHYCPRTESASVQETLVETRDLRAFLNGAMLTCLDDRERRAVRSHFGLGQEALSQAEIAQELRLSQQRVQKLLEGAIEKLRAEVRADEIMKL